MADRSARRTILSSGSQCAKARPDGCVGTVWRAGGNVADKELPGAAGPDMHRQQMAVPALREPDLQRPIRERETRKSLRPQRIGASDPMADPAGREARLSLKTGGMLRDKGKVVHL